MEAERATLAQRSVYIDVIPSLITGVKEKIQIKEADGDEIMMLATKEFMGFI